MLIHKHTHVCNIHTCATYACVKHTHVCLHKLYSIHINICANTKTNTWTHKHKYAHTYHKYIQVYTP